MAYVINTTDEDGRQGVVTKSSLSTATDIVFTKNVIDKAVKIPAAHTLELFSPELTLAGSIECNGAMAVV